MELKTKVKDGKLVPMDNHHHYKDVPEKYHLRLCSRKLTC